MADELVKKEPTELELVREELKIVQGQLEAATEQVRLLKREHTHLAGLTGKLVADQAAQNRRNLPVDWRTKQYIETEMPQARLEVRVVSAAFKIAEYIPFTPQMGKDEHAEFHMALRRLMEFRLGRQIPLTAKDAERVSDIQSLPAKSYEDYLMEGLKEPLPR